MENENIKARQELDDNLKRINETLAAYQRRFAMENEHRDNDFIYQLIYDATYYALYHGIDYQSILEEATQHALTTLPKHLVPNASEA